MADSSQGLRDKREQGDQEVKIKRTREPEEQNQEQESKSKMVKSRAREYKNQRGAKIKEQESKKVR
jgi:hypothetical protein